MHEWQSGHHELQATSWSLVRHISTILSLAAMSAQQLRPLLYSFVLGET
jgi:hypothetical protein